MLPSYLFPLELAAPHGGLAGPRVGADEGEVARGDGAVDVALAVRALALAVVLLVKVGGGVLVAAAARRAEEDDHAGILQQKRC